MEKNKTVTSTKLRISQQYINKSKKEIKILLHKKTDFEENANFQYIKKVIKDRISLFMRNEKIPRVFWKSGKWMYCYYLISFFIRMILISMCIHAWYREVTIYTYIVGPWSNGTRCGMKIPRPGFNSQWVLKIAASPWASQLNHSLGGLLLD